MTLAGGCAWMWAMPMRSCPLLRWRSGWSNACLLYTSPHAYLRDYGVCRVCFRTLAYKGEIPGVRKASW